MAARAGATGLGAVIRRSRLGKGLTLQELARRVGVHFTTVSSWERGRSMPGYDAMPRLAAALGTSPQELFGGLWKVSAPEERTQAVLQVIPGRAWEEFRRALESLRFGLAADRARQSRHLGLEDVGSKTGIDSPRLREILSGKVDPTILEALAISSVVGLRVVPGETDPGKKTPEPRPTRPRKTLDPDEIQAKLQALPDGPRERILALVGQLVAWAGPPVPRR